MKDYFYYYTYKSCEYVKYNKSKIFITPLKKIELSLVKKKEKTNQRTNDVLTLMSYNRKPIYSDIIKLTAQHYNNIMLCTFLWDGDNTRDCESGVVHTWQIIVSAHFKRETPKVRFKYYCDSPKIAILYYRGIDVYLNMYTNVHSILDG